MLSGKEYGLKKLFERAEKESEKDWKKTRFAYAISFMKTCVIQIKECIQQLLDSVGRCCSSLAHLQGSHSSYVCGKEVYFQNQENYICMNGLSDDDLKRLKIVIHYIRY